jgi:hypothetical protein
MCVCVFTCRLFCCCLPVGAYHSRERGVEREREREGNGDKAQKEKTTSQMAYDNNDNGRRPAPCFLLRVVSVRGVSGGNRLLPLPPLLYYSSMIRALFLSHSFLPPCPCVSLLVGVCVRVRSEGECQLLASQEGVSGRASEREQIRRSFPVAPLWAGPRPTTGAKKRHAVFQQK